MNAQEYIEEIGRLIGTGRDEEALALASRVGPGLIREFTPEEFFHVASMLEGAEMAVSFEQAARGTRRRGHPADPDKPAEAIQYQRRAER